MRVSVDQIRQKVADELYIITLFEVSISTFHAAAVTLVSPAKLAESIEMRFVEWTRAGPGNRVLGGGLDPPGQVHFLMGGIYWPIVTHTHTHTRLVAPFPGLPGCAGSRR